MPCCIVFSLSFLQHTTESTITTPQYRSVGLTELLEAIAIEDDIDSGTSLYKQKTPDGISLEGIGVGDDSFLDASTNPLFAIYMYAYWRSTNGSGKDGNDQPRSEMQWLDEIVDQYGHTIIMDEFGKDSEYDSLLTADTIRVTNVWMATVQSLYNAVEQCDERDDDNNDVDDPMFVNAVDQAAAFWFGDIENLADFTGGTMYAYAERIREQFQLKDNSNNVNEKMIFGLNYLKTTLSECLDPTISDDDAEAKALQMRMRVDELTRYMTVLLVQNLIHHAALVATSSETPKDPNLIDYVILYGLVTLPQIIVCDEYAFDDLYQKLVLGAKAMTRDDLRDALKTIYSRLVCLGITCDDIGTSVVLSSQEDDWPSCLEPTVEFTGYRYPTGQALEYLEVDLDIRTIGTLIEMDASTAAYDVYHWGRHIKDANGRYVALQTTATEEYHVGNVVGKSFESYFSPTKNYADLHEYKAMMGQGDFANATPTQRRIITEGTMVTITLHAHALNLLYKAIEVCTTDGQMGGFYWDQAFASLSGWAEGTEGTEGFLFMEIARFLCERTSAGCTTSEINLLLIAAMEGGKTSLTSADCTAAETRVKEVEQLLQTILVDITAYFANLIAEDTTDADNLAEGCEYMIDGDTLFLFDDGAHLI